MKPLRGIAAFAVLLMAGSLIYLYAWLPFAWARSRKVVESRIKIAARTGSDVRRVLLVRENLKVTSHFERLYPIDPTVHMYKGVSLALVGRNSDAITSFRRAIHYEPRPEIFINLGLSQLAVGDRSGAVESLATAVRFDVNRAHWIDDRAIRTEVLRKAADER